MRSIGIDIGSSSIKVAEIEVRNKSYDLVNFEIFPLGTNPAFDGEVEVIELLRALVGRYQNMDGRFVVALKQEAVALRLKSFPFSDRLKIVKSLPFELEEDLPLPTEESLFEIRPIRQLGQTTEILAFAAAKSLVGTTVQKFRDSGFDPDCLTVESAALANVYERWQDSIQVYAENPEPPRLQLILHIGHSRTLAMALLNDRLVASRTIFWGGKVLAETLVKRYEIPFQQALTELINKGFILPVKTGASYDQVTFSDSLSGGFKDLIAEVKLTLMELRSQFMMEVDEILVSGGVSRLIHLPAFLTRMTGLRVNIYDPLEKFRGQQIEISVEGHSVCALALGLAIEGCKRPKNPALNFLKDEFAKNQQHFKAFLETWGSALQAGAILFVMVMIYSMVRESASLSLTNSMEEAFKKQAAAVTGLPVKTITPKSIEKWIAKHKKAAGDEKLVVAFAKMESGLDILKKLGDSVPPRSRGLLEFRRFVLQDTQLEIEGYVGPGVDLASIRGALSQMSEGGKVDSITPRLALQPGKTIFSYRAKVDRKIKRSATL